VYADVTFRGEYQKSNELTICQEALTGYWSARDRREFTNFTVQGHPSNTTIYSCSREYVYLTGTATYKDWYHWIDKCGTNYTNITSAVTTTEGCDTKFCNVSGPSTLNCSGTAQFSYTSGSSSVKCAEGYVGWNGADCCSGPHTDSITLSKTFGGKTGKVTWTWICRNCDSGCNGPCPQNHSCADCADESSSRWGCSNCAKQLGCDKCLDYLSCTDCPDEKSCTECPDLDKCKESNEGT
jgi:LSD1 subclass zinc finger protein